MLFVTLLVLWVVVNTSKAVSPCQTKCPYSNSSYVLGYYWRDYFGTVPDDAFPGGIDEEAQATFIGQVYIKEYELLPGTLYRGCPKIRTSAYQSELTPDKNIKILCTNSGHKLKWKPAKQGELYKLTNCHLVIGGSEAGLVVYIGRTVYNCQTIIGKVFQDDATNSGLWIPGTNNRFTDFEVLTYNC
ncbi:hypothetical protein FQR65_LT17249 [Abscondita terminalis]|nr:hypothetical protein FQR65_LT17249 [Abscondita terminalis]